MERKTLGLDNGYRYTKDSLGNKFLSTIKEGKDISYNKDTIRIKYDGVDYIIGHEAGDYVADVNKVHSNVTKLCTLTALAMAFPEEPHVDVKLAVGLPVTYFNKQNEDFRKVLLGYGTQEFEIFKNGKFVKQSVTISSVDVYPQSVGVILLDLANAKSQRNLVIDIGGSTVDVSIYNGLKMLNWATYNLGMMNLYGSMIKEVNPAEELSEKPHKMDEFIEKGVLKAGNKTVPLSKYSYIIDSHVKEIANSIKHTFNDWKTVDNIYITGGGSIRLKPQLEREFADNTPILTEDAQFTNAKAFGLMADMK